MNSLGKFTAALLFASAAAQDYTSCDENRFMKWVEEYGMQFRSVEEFEIRFK